MVSAQIQEQIVDMLVALVVKDKCCGAGDLEEAQSGARQGLVWEQIVNVSAPLISELGFQRITWEVEPLILNLAAEAVPSVR